MARPEPVRPSTRLPDGEFWNRTRRRLLPFGPRQRGANQRSVHRTFIVVARNVVFVARGDHRFRLRPWIDRLRRRFRFRELHRLRQLLRRVRVGLAVDRFVDDALGRARRNLRVQRAGRSRSYTASASHRGRPSQRLRGSSRGVREDNNRPECHQAEAGAVASNLPTNRWLGMRMPKGGGHLSTAVSHTRISRNRPSTAAGAVD